MDVWVSQEMDEGVSEQMDTWTSAQRVIRKASVLSSPESEEIILQPFKGWRHLETAKETSSSLILESHSRRQILGQAATPTPVFSLLPPPLTPPPPPTPEDETWGEAAGGRGGRPAPSLSAVTFLPAACSA